MALRCFHATMPQKSRDDFYRGSVLVQVARTAAPQKMRVNRRHARYERAATELPIRHLIKLCQLYNVSSDYILGFDPNRRALKVSALGS